MVKAKMTVTEHTHTLTHSLTHSHTSTFDLPYRQECHHCRHHCHKHLQCRPYRNLPVQSWEGWDSCPE